MAVAAIPPGFGPILRSSPVLEALGSFYSRGAGGALEIGLLATDRHANSRGTVHGGVLATLADIGMGYLLSFGADPPVRLLTVSLSIDYLGAARVGDWIEVRVDRKQIGRKVAFANCYLMAGETAVARANTVFSVVE